MTTNETDKEKKLKNTVEMSRYIDIELYNKVEMTHPYYIEMLQEILKQVRKNKNNDNKTKILEIGAGTGIVTSRLANIQNVTIDSLEIDTNCCKALMKHIKNKNVSIVQGDAVTFIKNKPYDIVVSSFAHDHIHFSRRKKLAKNIASNLKQNGVYIVGLEILPKFSTEKERKQALYKYHNHIIGKAKKDGHHKLAKLEHEALVSGIKKIGDFKTHVRAFENEMKPHFIISFKEKIGPINKKTGGVYVYTFKKRN